MWWEGKWILSPHHKRYYERARASKDKGVRADEKRCAKQLANLKQCSRSRGHGPLGAFCKVHGEQKFDEIKKIGVRYTRKEK